MSAADSLKYLHILLFVAWLGVDVGVFSSSFVVRRRGLSGETRVVLRRVMRALDLAPRLSLVLMIPVAVSLAHATGKGALGIPPVLLGLLGAAALAWCAAQLWNFRQTDALGNLPRPERRTWTRLIGRVDTGLRLIAAGAFLLSGVWSIAGDGPWKADTVAWKATIFGAVILAGLWIRYGGRAFGSALRGVVADGESDARLRQMDAAMWRIYPAVLGIWAALLVLAGIPIFA